MLFKNFSIFTISELFSEFDLMNTIAHRKFRPLLNHLDLSYGWIPFTGNEDDELPLVFSMGSISLLTLQIQKKSISSKVLNQQTARRVAELKKNGTDCSAKDVRDIKSNIKIHLLSKLPSTYSRVFGYIDFEKNVLVIGSASTSEVDLFTTCLAKTLSSLSITPIQHKSDPSNVLTNWLNDFTVLPSSVDPGTSVVVQNETGNKSKGSFTKQDLSSQEIVECLLNGKKVQRLQIHWNKELSFTIDDHCIIRNCKPLNLDDSLNIPEDNEEDKDVHPIAADLYLTVQYIRSLTDDMISWFGIEIPTHIDTEQ